MAKLNLTTITSGYATVDALNTNFDAIETALENTLSRDGTAPNSMSANLDMNSQRIVNLPSATTASEPITLAQWEAGATSTPVDASAITYTQDGTGAVVNTVELVAKGSYNPYQFNAQEGVTSSQATNIQKSLDAVPEGGLWVLPEGTWYVGATLTFRKNCTYLFLGKLMPSAGFTDYICNFGKGTTVESAGPAGPGNRLTRMKVSGLWIDCNDQSRGIYTHRVDNATFKDIRIDKVCGTALRCTVTRECSFSDVFVWYGAPIATLTSASRNTEPLINLNDSLDIPAGFGDPNNKIDFFNLNASYCGATTYLSIDTTGASDVRDIRFFGGQIHYLDDFDVTNTVDYPRYGDSVSRADDAAVVLVDIQDCQHISFNGTLLNYPGKAGVAVRVGTSATKLAQYVSFDDMFINNAYVGGTAVGFQIRYGVDVEVDGCMPVLWNGSGTESTYIANFFQDPTDHCRKNLFGQMWVRRNTNGVGLYLDGSKSVGTLSPYVYMVSPDGRDALIRRASGDYIDVIVQHTDSSSRTTMRIEGNDKTTPAVEDHFAIYNPNKDGGQSIGKQGNRTRAVFFFPLNAEPSDKTSGMVCMADNATWDPLAVAGSDPYLVQYTGTTWKAI